MLKLSVINEACEGATPGPWEGDKATVITSRSLPPEIRRQTIAVCSPSAPPPLCPHCGLHCTTLRITEGEAHANRNFIALARTALPAFLLARKALSAYCAGSGDDTPLQVFDKALFDLAGIEVDK